MQLPIIRWRLAPMRTPQGSIRRHSVFNASATAANSAALGFNASAVAGEFLCIRVQGASAVVAGSVALGQGSIADRAEQRFGRLGGQRASDHERRSRHRRHRRRQRHPVEGGRDQGAATAAKLDGAVMYDKNTDGSVNRNSVTLGGDAAAEARSSTTLPTAWIQPMQSTSVR